MKSSSSPEIPVSQPAFFGNESKYLAQAFDSGQLSWHGAFVKRFELALAELLDAPYVRVCSSGTAALHLALLAGGLTKGKDVDVYVPALTYIATANAVSYCGARVVPVDVEAQTWCMSPSALRRAVDETVRAGRRPFAVIPVHLFGVPADMRSIVSIAEEFGMLVIEDAAESIGSEFDGKSTGTIGDFGCFSFFGNKTLSTGEGGAVVCHDERFMRAVELYRGQGMSTRRRYYHPVIGFNYRMTNLQSAVGLGQVETAELHFSRRQEIGNWYTDALGAANCSDIVRQSVPRGTNLVPWLLGIQVQDRDAVAERMLKQGVETRPMFVPLTDMPPYAGGTPIVARTLGLSGLCLPLFATMTREQVEKTVDALVKSV